MLLTEKSKRHRKVLHHAFLPIAPRNSVRPKYKKKQQTDSVAAHVLKICQKDQNTTSVSQNNTFIVSEPSTVKVLHRFLLAALAVAIVSDLEYNIAPLLQFLLSSFHSTDCLLLSLPVLSRNFHLAGRCKGCELQSDRTNVSQRALQRLLESVTNVAYALTIKLVACFFSSAPSPSP